MYEEREGVYDSQLEESLHNEVVGEAAGGVELVNPTPDQEIVETAREQEIRNRRKQLRNKFTRAVNRVKGAVRDGDRNRRKLNRELEEIRQHFYSAREAHDSLYDFVTDGNTGTLDQWETRFVNEFYDIENELDDYLKALQVEHSDIELSSRNTNTNSTMMARVRYNEGTNANLHVRNHNPEHNQTSTQLENVELSVEAENSQTRATSHIAGSSSHVSESLTGISNTIIISNQQPEVIITDKPFDSWIDELVEFKATVTSSHTHNLSIADALYKLESSRDVPTIELTKFNGNPLDYVEFIDKFKVHIHDKPNLTDDMRMLQLKMHVTGEAGRIISGLGSGGLMYVTALKLIKEQFGQRSVIARSVVDRLTRGAKIAAGAKQALRDFSIDIINSLAIFHQIKYLADVNANVTLRQIVSRLPDYLIREWKGVASSLRDRGEYLGLEQISNFLRRKVRSEFDPDFGDLDRGKLENSFETKIHRNKVRGVGSVNRQTKVYKCFVCQDSHRVLDCPKFNDSSVENRFKLAKVSQLCFSCLMTGHQAQDCRSKKECQKDGCKRFHHVLLHTDPPPASSANSALDRECIMPVVRVLFRANNGKCREGNVLIDSGAGTTIIRTEFAKSLGLQGKQVGLEISVVGGQRLAEPQSRRVRFYLQNLTGGPEYAIEAHEIERTIISAAPLDKPWLRSFTHLQDIDFQQKAGPIDLILGVQYSHLHAKEEVRQGKPFDPVGKLTRLGWYVIGSSKGSQISAIKQVNFVEKVNLEKFYQFETLGIQAPDCSCQTTSMSPEDKQAMVFFESSCQRKNERYVIGLPWKEDPTRLQDNYSLALRRLVSLENNLRRNEQKSAFYDKTVMEYVNNDWARKVTDEDRGSDYEGPVYYLPHHGVYRPEKVSTPLRIVFDPACEFQGKSLNSLLLKGPCLIGNLLAVLLRFREDYVGFTGDISKMFLQICLPESDTHVHRFLWRNMDSSREPDIYRLMRVTFGDKPSPDMASFVILKIAEECREAFPNAAEILNRDRYVDDLIHSCSTKDEALCRMDQLDKALATGSFKIKEWVCSESDSGDGQVSSSSCNSTSEVSGRSKPVSLDREHVKTLGVCWVPTRDTIRFVVKNLYPEKFTKRTILSKISMLFDPIGLASAVTIKSRIAMQDVWRCKQLDWDDRLPPEMVSTWQSIFSELEELNGSEFPRCLKPKDVIGVPEMHVFVDASAKAYGAAAYLRYPLEHGSESRLIAAKGRVAPLKQTTIPRLELMAALVGSRLATVIYQEFKVKPSSVTFWTDSQTVLRWVQSDSIRLKPFVGVRVAEIQSSWDPGCWRYVPTDINPADDLSRGISASQMNGRWKRGPEFLCLEKSSWPEVCIVKDVDDDPEIKKRTTVVGAVAHKVPVVDPEKYSSWVRLVRVTAYCVKFIRKLQSKLKPRESIKTSLLRDEIETAENYWIKVAQQELSDRQTRCQDLSPFLKEGIIRVGGRLRHAPLEYDQIHPVLLPASNHVSLLIMRNAHQLMGHAGAERTLAESRRRFWVIRGRSMAKGIVRSCVICRKMRQRPHKTLMADLPSERVKPFIPPFAVTGVDLFGPFNLRVSRNKTTKAWGAVFTCANIRAIHLEVVDGLSSEAFLHALRRFAAHHGWPARIISDNGTNFVGAQAELRKLAQDERKQLEDFASTHRIKWTFNTPLSPHQGGFYESLVKQTKRALQVAIGPQVLTWNEMTTAFAEAESLINSRPLGYAPNDPNDPQPITPNHFLLGRASLETPSLPFEETKNIHKRFQQVQMTVNQFWKRFVREYFPTLMRRNKWQVKGRQLQIGDIVLVTDPNTLRGKWSLGRILEIFPGKDGIVRNVKIRTKNGVYSRSTHSCCPLLEADDAQSLGPPRNGKKLPNNDFSLTQTQQ